MSHFPFTLGIKVFSLLFFTPTTRGVGVWVGVGAGVGGVGLQPATEDSQTKTSLRIPKAFPMILGRKKSCSSFLGQAHPWGGVLKNA